MTGGKFRLRGWWFALALALAALAAWAVPWWLGPRVPVVRLTPGSLLRTVVASGRVETPLRVEVGSQITASVSAVPVAAGQSVVAGQPLVLLDGAEARATVEQARASVQQAEARLHQLRELALPSAAQAVRQAEVNLRNAEAQYARQQQLRAAGFIGQAQLDDARRSLDLADSQLRNSRLQLRSNESNGSEVRLAEAALTQARASLAAAQARQAYTVLRAPVAGTLIARNIERGDVAQPGRVLMLLAPAGRTQLVTQIDERNLAALRVGQRALAAADAYPDQRFAAVLAYINPGIDPARGTVQVKFDVPEAPAFLRQDMTVSVETEVERKEQVLVVPAQALQTPPQADGTASVLKLVDGRARLQSVRLGARDAARVEVVAGLVAGDQVIVASGIAEGWRVRPAAAGDGAAVGSGGAAGSGPVGAPAAAATAATPAMTRSGNGPPLP